MNYKKLFLGFLCIALVAAALVLAGCGGGDCGISCGRTACGFGCNGHCGFIGMPFLDGCTVIGCAVCDTCGHCVGSIFMLFARSIALLYVAPS